MEHPVHEKIKALILAGTKTRAELAEKLDMTTRTLIKRLQRGDWQLSELAALEEIYGVKIFAKGAEYFTEDKHGEVNEMAHTYDEPSGYKINIQIDPDHFKPQDLDQLNKELTERLIEKYKRRNGDG